MNLGLNLSLKGQRIIPKLAQKREIKCERTENKSLQSIYTLARLASSSSRVRRTASSNGPTIMDFMQCINFKSRLDREREMIRRKIRSSTLYRKPSFNKNSGFNIYNCNVNGDVSKMSMITKNMKITDFTSQDQSLSLRRVKSPLLACDEQNDENLNEDKEMLCVGNKYLDLTSNLTTTASIAKSISTLNLINNESFRNDKPNKLDFQKAITQSHLSPESSNFYPKKEVSEDHQKLQENFLKTKPANFYFENEDSKKKTTEDMDNGDKIDDVSPGTKRKEYTKIIKKSTHFMYAIGINVGKYSDAQKTEVPTDELAESSVIKSQNSTQNTSPLSTIGSKAKKSVISSQKKSSHGKKSDSKMKNNSSKTSTTRKSESSLAI